VANPVVARVVKVAVNRAAAVSQVAAASQVAVAKKVAVVAEGHAVVVAASSLKDEGEPNWLALVSPPLSGPAVPKPG
jgi:hypothetical protein